MNKTIAGILAALFVILLAINSWRFLSSDRSAPRISFSPNSFTWTEDDGEEALLQGVTATDKVDGDVTSSVRIKSITPMEDGRSVIVVYFAKDSHHNISTANRILSYTPSKTEAEKKAEAEAESKAAEESSIAESIRESEEESIRESEEEESRSIAEEEATATTEEETLSPEEENESRIAELPEGAPHIYLSHYVVGVPVGGQLNLLSYVSAITDDQDSHDFLAGRIEIEGAENINYNQVGEYEVRFYVRDSQGTRSNAAIMKVIVQSET